MKRIKVDNIDNDLIENFKWSISKGSKKSTNELWYAVRRERKNGVMKNFRLHREIMSRICGRQLSKEEYVDHINYDGLDNRRKNLRILTSSENSRYRRMNSNNSSGIRGIRKLKNGSWLAQICLNRQVIYIGSYSNKNEASIAFDAVFQFIKKLHLPTHPHPVTISRSSE